MDIRIIISMFEDLKKLILEKFSNLLKLVESLANAKFEQPVLPIIPLVNLSVLENHTAQTKELIEEGFKKHQEQSDELGQKLQKQQDPPYPSKIPPHHRAKPIKGVPCIGLTRYGTSQFSELQYLSVHSK